MNFEEKNKILEQEIKNLKLELEQTKEHLKKYTAPSRWKKYYDNHKEELNKRAKEFITPEKKKEYNKKYYEKKKQEKQEEIGKIPDPFNK